MFGTIGNIEIFIVLLVALLLFGSKQLPQVAKNVGKGIRDFQKAAQSARDEIHKMIEEDDRKPVDRKPDDRKPVEQSRPEETKIED